jgi:hypothetical protein
MLSLGEVTDLWCGYCCINACCPLSRCVPMGPEERLRLLYVVFLLARPGVGFVPSMPLRVFIGLKRDLLSGYLSLAGTPQARSPRFVPWAWLLVVDPRIRWQDWVRVLRLTASWSRISPSSFPGQLF